MSNVSKNLAAAAGASGRRPLQGHDRAPAPSFPQRGIGVKLTITGDFKQSKQQKQAKSKDVFALKKHKTNEAFQVK
ncbi:MAG: hypothetical protein IJF88_00085, partial [Oscillospiraceae bacterium]|nr:hypothetical protein [Oscillospiraceae bacterium]